MEGLGEFETEFREPRWTARGNKGVGRGFESREAGADDEQGAAEAAKGAVHSTRPEHQSAHPVDAESGDEGPAIAELAYNPPRIRKRSDEVSSEIGTLKTSGFCSCDVEGCLEFCVKYVQ